MEEREQFISSGWAQVSRCGSGALACLSEYQDCACCEFRDDEFLVNCILFHWNALVHEQLTVRVKLVLRYAGL